VRDRLEVLPVLICLGQYHTNRMWRIIRQAEATFTPLDQIPVESFALNVDYAIANDLASIAISGAPRLSLGYGCRMSKRSTLYVPYPTIHIDMCWHGISHPTTAQS
jgi:hypothetical protein